MQQEEFDVLPLSTWSTEVFNRNRIKKSAILVNRMQLCPTHPPPWITELSYFGDIQK